MMSIPSSHVNVKGSRVQETNRCISAGLHRQHPRAKRGSPGARGIGFGKREQTSGRNISSSDSGRCSADRMRFDVHLHNVMSIVNSLMWTCLFFTSCTYLTRCYMLQCYKTDWLRLRGWSKMCRDRASHCKRLCCSNYDLGSQCLMMIYKASILRDFRIFRVTGMYTKDSGEHIILPWRMYHMYSVTFVVLKIDVVCFHVPIHL